MITMNASSDYYQFSVESAVLEHVKDALRTAIRSDTDRMGLSKKVSSVCFVAESLYRHLQRLLTLEEDVGYAELLEEIKPHLHDRATALLCEHHEIRNMLEHLISAQKTLRPEDERDFLDYCENVMALLDKIDRHETSERIILQEVYCSEEGGEG
jgi:hemerythrin-like domain-containing protein